MFSRMVLSSRKLALLLTLGMLLLPGLGTQAQSAYLTRPGNVRLTVNTVIQSVSISWSASRWQNDPDETGGSITYKVSVDVTKESITTTVPYTKTTATSVTIDVSQPLSESPLQRVKATVIADGTHGTYSILSAVAEGVWPARAAAAPGGAQGAGAQGAGARLNRHTGAPVIVYGSNGQLAIYAINGDAGTLILTVPNAASLVASGAAAGALGSVLNPFSDKSVAVNFDGASVIVNTDYADTPYATDKPYIIRFDAGNEVAIVAW